MKMRTKLLALSLVAIPALTIGGIQADKAKTSKVEYKYVNKKTHYFNSEKIEIKSNTKTVTKYDYVAAKCKHLNKDDIEATKKPLNCSLKKSETTYTIRNGKSYQLNYTKFDKNGKKIYKEVITRNSSLNMSKLLVQNFYTNGKVKNTSQFFGGRHLKQDRIVYNQSTYKTYNNKGKLTRSSAYKNAMIQSGASKTVRTYHKTYTYNKYNKLVKTALQRRNAKTNSYIEKKNHTYRSNGKKLNQVIYKYNGSGKLTSRYTYSYNRKGQLKSNKNGNAYRKIKVYNDKGKGVAYKSYKYNGKGKAKRI